MDMKLDSRQTGGSFWTYDSENIVFTPCSTSVFSDETSSLLIKPLKKYIYFNFHTLYHTVADVTDRMIISELQFHKCLI